jgi:hypothetical protein
VRSVDSKEAGREDSAPKSLYRCDADAFSLAEGSIWQRPLWRGRAGVAGVPSPGHASKEIGREPKRAPHLLPHQEERLLHREVREPEGRPEGSRRDGEQSYDPIVPVKVGNRRASLRSGHGTHWREGGNKQRIW